MRRILVIGCSGAGKSTFARMLGEILDLPVIHLDAFFWQQGWVPTPKAEWRAVVERLCGGKCWIMDGNYGSTLGLRLQAADAVILFDFSRARCLWGVMRRWLRYIGKTRPDMGPGCPEKVDAPFLRWIWRFNRAEKPQILQMLVGFKGQLFIMKNRRDEALLIENIRRQHPAGVGLKETGSAE